MATRISNISALQDDKNVTPYSELAAKPQIQSDVLVRLATFLQTTLDYQKVLNIFKREIADAVLVDSIRYDNEELGLEYSINGHSQHSCQYQLNTQSENLGTMTFTRATRFREHELANIEALMGTLIYPLRNALRYRKALDQAYKDPLTGAGNRISLDESLCREMELAKRHNYDLSFIMLDLDHFKSINDEFGHLVGDEVLKAVVNKIKDCIRQTDICFRYGGEEFVVILNNANIANARLIAERIRMGINALVIESENGTIKPSISAGLTIMHEDDSGKDLIERSDKALYLAKNSGRNKVCLLEIETTTTPEADPA